MRLTLLALALALSAATRASAAPDVPCGWAVPSGQTLAFRPDPALDPRAKGTLPKPPRDGVAAYCHRDSMVVEHPDFRILKELRLPYIVEAGGRYGVLQLEPGIVLNYHTEGNRFVRGRAPAPNEQKTRT